MNKISEVLVKMQTLISSVRSLRVRLSSALSAFQTSTFTPLYTAILQVDEANEDPTVSFRDNVDNTPEPFPTYTQVTNNDQCIFHISWFFWLKHNIMYPVIDHLTCPKRTSLALSICVSHFCQPEWRTFIDILMMSMLNFTIVRIEMS